MADAGRLTGPSGHVCVIWQRFLPYHLARIREFRKRMAEMGGKLTAMEIAAFDKTYGFPSDSYAVDPVRCFERGNYHDHRAADIHRQVLTRLIGLRPDVVFAPATAFPEGMAAIAYRRRFRAKVVLMDAAWERTDRKGSLTRQVKRIIHRNVDAALVPAPSHLAYYKNLGFPEDRIFFGVDAVDNDLFAAEAASARQDGAQLRKQLHLPERYFLYVGRFIQRKGVHTLLSAYRRYRLRCGQNAWGLVLVGAGPEADRIRAAALNLPGVRLAGPQYGLGLCRHYGLASALVVPSDADPWGLVVNEAMASSLPVLVSTGCGAARTLVSEGVNGWVFEPGDAGRLFRLMIRLAELPEDRLAEMGSKSRQIVDHWSLTRFVQGALDAMSVPRRLPAGGLSDLAVRLWKGRVNTH